MTNTSLPAPQTAVAPPTEQVDVAETSHQQSKLPPAFSLRFSTRGMSLALDVIVLMQITFYATDIVGLPAALVGALFLGAKIFDGFTDLVIGFFIDRTKTRWGRARPYELFIVPAWLLTIAIFSTPEMDTFWQAAYLFVMYALITSVCHTSLLGAEGVYLKRALKGEVRYAKVLSRQGVFVLIVGALGSALLPQLMATWGTEPGGWTKIALAYGIPMMIIGLIRFLTIKELPVSEIEEAAEKRVGVKVALGALMRNRFVFVLAGMVLLANTITNVTAIVGAYYFKYIFGDVGLLSIAAIGGLVIPVVLLLFPIAVRTIGALNFVRLGFLLAMVGYTLIFFFPTNLPIVIVGQVLSAFTSTITLMIGFFVIQAMQYGEWKTGHRIDAVTNSVTNFTSKIGSAVASAGVGLLLGIAGYNGLAEVQTASADAMIINLNSLVPFLLTAAMLALSYLYKLDRYTGAINRDLAAGIHADTSDLKI